MFDFVHRENIRRFERALETCTEPHERDTLLQLIAEEKAKLEDALRVNSSRDADTIHSSGN